jgi:hypothetical protein
MKTVLLNTRTSRVRLADDHGGRAKSVRALRMPKLLTVRFGKVLSFSPKIMTIKGSTATTAPAVW